jgi:cytochrome c-type biogenesis protein CcmH/NrfF
MVIANTFILWVLGAAAFLGVAALVQKRTRRDRDVAEQSSNHAS